MVFLRQKQNNRYLRTKIQLTLHRAKICLSGLVKTYGMISGCVTIIMVVLSLCIISRLKLQVGTLTSCPKICLTVVTTNKYYSKNQSLKQELIFIQISIITTIQYDKFIRTNYFLTHHYMIILQIVVPMSVVTINKPYVYGDQYYLGC